MVRRAQIATDTYQTEVLHKSLPCMIETLEPVMAEMWKGLPGDDYANDPTRVQKVAINLYVHQNYPPLVSLDDTIALDEPTHFVQLVSPADKYGTIYMITGVRDYRKHMLYLLERSTLVALPA